MYYFYKEKHMKKLAYISQPMKGLTQEEITEKREKITKLLHEAGYEVINSINILPLKDVTKPLVRLTDSLRLLAMCDLAYFAENWDKAGGCTIEHMCCLAYGIDTKYE